MDNEERTMGVVECKNHGKSKEAILSANEQNEKHPNKFFKPFKCKECGMFGIKYAGKPCKGCEHFQDVYLAESCAHPSIEITLIRPAIGAAPYWCPKRKNR